MTDDDTPTVLIIEDDEQLLDLYRHFLDGNYTVRTASSGAAGLDRFDDDVDVVLLDRRMPQMSGDEVLTELRSRGFEGPVTMVTAVEPDTDIVDMAFDDYLVKPISRADLADAVDTMLRRADYDESVRRFFALSSKVAVLEVDHSQAELGDNPQYQELTDQLAAVRDEAESKLGSLSSDEVDRLFRDIGAATIRSSDDVESGS